MKPNSDVSLKPGASALHRKLAAVTLVLGVILITIGVTGSDDVEAKRITVPLSLSVGSMVGMPTEPSPTPPGSNADGNSAGTPNPGSRTPQWRTETVRRGDNLSLIFGRAGLQAGDMQLLLSGVSDAKSMRNIFPGQLVSFQLDGEDRLLAVRYEHSPLETTVFSRTENGFTAREIARQPEIRHAYRHAKLTSSLFDAGQSAGVSGRLLIELATIFGGVIDFALDARAGDSFSVLYEENYLDGEKIGEGDIVAAEYTTADHRYSAFAYIDSSGERGYYSEDGVSMRKAFLRAPLDITRVSSNFSMRRFHPIAKVFRPHLGVDYAASTGTPVYASGDGRVVASSYSRGNGNYIFIQHDAQIMTRYLHLHKRMVATGDRVTQGQTIGAVGSTGLATGPHLHYEFLVDGVHRNPRLMLDKLPRSISLARNELARFRESTAGLNKQLATYTTAWEMAVASTSSSQND